MTGYIAKLRERLGLDSGNANAVSPGDSADRRVERGPAGSPSPAVGMGAVGTDATGSDGTGSDASDGGQSAGFEVPDTPTDAYHELGMSPEALLSELVEANDGWTWQRDLVSETGWSASSVSRYLSAMEDDGRIVRVSVGRTNAVGFPDVIGDRAADGRRPAGA